MRWLDRCIAAHKRPNEQNLFPIVQGGLDADLRAECAKGALFCWNIYIIEPTVEMVLLKSSFINRYCNVSTSNCGTGVREPV